MEAGYPLFQKICWERCWQERISKLYQSIKKKKNYVYINPYEASSSKTFQNELKDIAHNCSNKLFIILSTPDFFFSSFIKEQLICVAETGNQSFSVKDKKKKKKTGEDFLRVSLYFKHLNFHFFQVQSVLPYLYQNETLTIKTLAACTC